ncbi:PHD finger protein MALE MEIOCYTE DEATH 1-like [Hordeum vulgare]|nr:PHD finger protein MALE MEIOCYTE DEATH 1-like [Hordeum vulgare]
MFDQMLIERLIQEHVAEEVPGAAAQLFDSKTVLNQVVIKRLFQEQVAEEVPDAVAQLFDSKTVFDQVVIQGLTQEQATNEEENRRWKQQFNSLRAEEEMYRKEHIWALFDNLNGMPRYYATIKGFDASNFKVHLTWLERIAMNEAEEKWSDEELLVACGSFSLGTTDISQDRLMFSHIVSWKANGGNMKYIPIRCPSCKRFEDVVERLNCRFSKKRLVNAAEVVVEKLLEHGNDAQMTRQAVRDAARVEIGDTGLLDFVIKSVGDTVVGNHVVAVCTTLRRVCSSSALRNWKSQCRWMLRYRTPVLQHSGRAQWMLSGICVLVYRAMVEALSEAAQAVLDCKHWVKCWGLGDESDDQLRFLVEWRPQPWEAAELTRPLPSGEIIVVPVHTSIGELIIQAEHALRDTYCFFEEFQAEMLDGITGEKWDPVVLGGAESGDTIGVHGHGAGHGDRATMPGRA